MNAANNPLIAELLSASADDESALRFPLPHRVFGFHVQQAIEKLLKVLITAHGEEHPFTHDIGRLVAQVQSLGDPAPSFSLTFNQITAYAVQARYQSGAVLAEAERNQLRMEIVALRDYVDRRLEAFRSAGD